MKRENLRFTNVIAAIG